MATTNTSQGAGRAVPVAVVGLATTGRNVLAALRETDGVEIVAVSDHNAALAEEVGRMHGIPHFGDNRSLLAEARPQVAFVSVPPMQAGELLSACAQREVHVWKDMPLARNLDEAVAMVRRMEKEGLKFAIGTQWRWQAGYARAVQWVPRLGQTFLCRAHYLFNWGPNLGWRTDKASAGGGALLELAYHPIDLLTHAMGLPEEVYGCNVGGFRSDWTDESAQQSPPYDTDDTAASILRYRDGAMATVVATRSSGPVSEEICFHGRDGSLSATSERCVLRGPDGNLLENFSADRPSPVAAYRQMVRSFLQAIAEDAPIYPASARENLLTHAIIEALYLANRTAHPESPMRLLRNCKLDEAACLIHTPQPVEPPPDLPPSASTACPES